jgi:DNA-binding NtrC family response regulator
MIGMPNPHCSILLVEGDRELREILTRALLRRGFRVTAVDHPRQALEAVTVRPYHVAILNCAPSDQSPAWLMQKLKSQLGRLEVILLGTGGDEEFQAEATSLGAFACLQKPFALHELVEAISAAYEESQFAVSSPVPA